jgi:hypothetical protein
MVEAIPNFRESSLFTAAEKAALRLADAMAGDHKQAPYDEIFAELRKLLQQGADRSARLEDRYLARLWAASPGA